MSRYKLENNKMRSSFIEHTEMINSQQSTNINHNLSRDHNQNIKQIPSLKIKTYSFQDVQTDHVLHFTKQIIQLNTLLQVSKRVTDPNVLILNSSQKQMVEMIVQNNKNAQDQKSKYLRQRAGKYLKIIWKSQKFNDSYKQKWPKIQNIPRYASPIHNFKQIKKSQHKSKRSLSSKIKQTKYLQTNLKMKNNPKQKSISPVITQRAKRIHSQDHKFEHISLSPKLKLEKKTPIKQHPDQKSFQSQLSQNLIWKTVNTTKQFDNMLKILRKQI